MKPKVIGKLFVAGIVFLSQGVVVTQAQTARDREEIMSTLEAFFDALAARDTVAIWKVTEPGARLVVTSSDSDGNPTMRPVPMSDFMKRIAREGPAVREEIWDPKVTVHDNLATVWLKYNFFVEERIDHCGEDNFQLFRSTNGWKIIAIADTQRRTGCAKPG